MKSLASKPARVAALVLVLLGVRGVALAQDCEENAVPLLVWDVITRGSRPWVFSVRTCQPRGLSQGGILLRRPLRSLPPVRKARIFAAEKDATIEAIPGPAATEIEAAFSAPDGTINIGHGPLLGLLMQRENGLAVGESYPLTIDPTRTELIDPEGEPVPFCVFGGRFTAVDEDAPFTLSVVDAVAAPGDRVLVAIATYELWLIERFEVSLFYDPAIFKSVTDILVWDYLEDIVYVVDTSIPGIVHVSLHSTPGSINILPGPLVEVEFEVSENADPGTTMEMSLSPIGSRVDFKNGDVPQLDLRPGTFTVLPPE